MPESAFWKLFLESKAGADICESCMIDGKRTPSTSSKHWPGFKIGSKTKLCDDCHERWEQSNDEWEEAE